MLINMSEGHAAHQSTTSLLQINDSYLQSTGLSGCLAALGIRVSGIEEK